MKPTTLLRNAFAVMLALLLAAAPFINKSANAEGALEVSADMEGATRIVFSQSGITAATGSYSGYTIEANEVKIDGSGTYILTGSSSNASVKVKKETKGVVLVLDNLTLSSETSAPITCAKSTEVTIIAAAGTVNDLSDTEMNNDETHADNLDAENAVIKCKDGSNVVICGTGTINVTANGKNGVKGGASTETEGESSLTVRELTLNIKANVNDALKADTLLNVESGNITIEAADDAIKSDYTLNIGSESGAGPNINIVSCSEGIEAATLNIYSGNIAINATDDGINAANSDLAGYSFECNFYGGKVLVNTMSGDGIDSNGSINFAGGEIEVYSSTKSDNSPFDADGGTTLSGGTVFGIGMPGMGSLPSNVEQAYVYFGAGGRGFGGMGGKPGFGQGGFPGENGTMPQPPTDANGNPIQPPTGENGTMPQPPTDANGNPIQPPTDANGNPIQPPTDANGNPIQPPTDAESGATQRPGRENGGFGGFPGQGGFPNQGGSAVSIAEGDTVEIVDSNGSTVYSAAAKRSASFVFLSCDSIKDGETYTLRINGTEAASAQAGKTGGAMGGFGGGRWGDNGAQNSGANNAESGASGNAANESGSNGTAANAVNLLHSNNSSSSKGFVRTIAIVLGAAALVGVGCVATIAVTNAKNRKKLASSDKDGGANE